MLKSLLTVVSAALFLCLANSDIRSQPPATAAQSRIAEREAEWGQYVVPQSTFVRNTDPTNTVLFRIPADWKQTQPDKLDFSAPHGTTLSLFIEKIPDGIPLRDFVAAIMQPLQNVPDSGDSLVVRRTTMSALEAREIMFESNADSVEVTRRIIWTTVSGPQAVSLVLLVPLSKVAEIEPYFKAVVQSVTLADKDNQADFDALRATSFADSGPTRVDHVQSLASALNALDGSSRSSNISKLAGIFASSPATAIDLTLDRRTMVRAGAVEAIAQSRNNSLEKFLLRALDDRELFVAERAARSVAANPNVIALLRDHSLEWFHIESLARVWPFLKRSDQTRIFQEAFTRSSSGPRRSPRESKSSKPGVTVRAKVLPPGSSPDFVSIGTVALAPDPSRQHNLLTLIHKLPASELSMPFSQIVAWKNDALTVLALQVGWWRHELLPPAELMKLLSSSNSEVRRLAALNLGQSAMTSDIKSLEGYLNKAVASVGPNSAPDLSRPNAPSPLLNEDLQLTITKIRLREQLSTTAGAERQQLIKKGLADPKLTEWVWYRFVRENVDPIGQPVASRGETAQTVKVLPLGENLFPKDVTSYAALPQPAAALDKLGAALMGLQLDSARSQANLVLIMSALREQLAQQLDSPPGADSIVYSGIDAKEPIAMASWYAEGAPLGIRSAERKGIVMRVSDRVRFERSLTHYQRSLGNFASLTDYFSGGVRFLTVMPAVLPISAKDMLDRSRAPATKAAPLLSYSFVEETEWNGYSIKVVEHRSVADSGHMTRDAAYLTYLGDTAVLAPDLDSLRDMLIRASSERDTLASNQDFKRLAGNANPGQNPGEAIYLSNVQQLVSDPSVDRDSPKDAVTESGALRISNSTWENFYEVPFTQSDWLKPFIGFQPEELKSPRDLLPRSTIAYYLMNVDAIAGWRDWSQLLGAQARKDLTSILAVDFEKDVLPELGPECGLAILSLPRFVADRWDVPWAAFFKLKSDKLAQALKDGKLLTGSPAGTGLVPLKVGEFFVIAKKGFLVISNSQAALSALDQNEKLFSSRDFSRAAKRAPAGLVAFGGYNLEAALSSIGDPGTDPIKSQQSSMISSLTNAFHSPNFYATATRDAVTGRFSLSMDREGRFSVSELSSLSKDYRMTFAQVEAHGVPIQNQESLSSLKLRIRASAAGQIDRIKEDVSSKHQVVDKISEKELELRVYPRHAEPKISLPLPIKGAEFAPYLQPDHEIRSDDKTVIEKALSIAGEERDAWKVARKLADWTYKNIKWKRVDDATAPQTLATLEADCLEFSQLYVAMARSLGLPARLVQGLAYAGSAFGGHAWVEVYVGDWIEVDPTWGTDFVDATHIRNSSDGALLTYASLNLIKLEVLEAPRGIADYQKDPRALATKLSQELPKGISTALASALDLAVLTNENLGAGTWESLSDSDRAVMSSAYRRVLLEIIAGYAQEKTQAKDLRILKVSETGDRAEVIVLQPGYGEPLEKLTFVQRNGVWFLTEMLQIDTDLHVISETLRPSLKFILDRRNNKPARGSSTSDFVRVLFVLYKDPNAAIEIADRALQEDPKDRGLRHLKALALNRAEKVDKAIELWKTLAAEAQPFSAALLNLARLHDRDDKVKQKQAIDFYIRYGELEPEDPRTHVALARLFEAMEDEVRAEAEHRAAIRADPFALEHFVDFAEFLAVRKRFKEADAAIDEAAKKAGADEDLFGDLVVQLYFIDDKTVMEEMARRQPRRMEKSALANLYLGYVRLQNDNSLEAIPLFRKASALKGEWAEPHGAMAHAYRAQRNWTAALNAAGAAIKIDPDYSDGYLSRACALARLGRIKEAVIALEKAVELDPDVREIVATEPDLKVLVARPEVKKLLTVEADVEGPKP